MKAKILLLIILGILAAVAMLFPAGIILGLFLGIVPGIILTLAPTVFVYYALALLLGIAIKYFKLPFQTFISLVFLIGVGCLASYLLNIPIVQQVKEFEKLDIALEKKFEIPKTIAIYSKHYETHGDTCNTLCQLLLFNKSTQKVLVIADPSALSGDIGKLITSYEIEEGFDCNNDHLISERWGNIAIKNVESRIAAGECLSKKDTKLSEAEIIFFHDKISQNREYQNYTSLKRRVIFANYIELLENKTDKFDKIYRYTEISAQPFAYPLSFGPILGAGGGSMSLNFGFFHKSLTVNNPGPSYGNVIEEFKPQMEKLFGDALKTPEESKQDAKQIISKTLEGKATEKAAGFAVLGNYLGDLYLRKKTPTDEDMQLVITALRDDRTSDWFHLSNFTWLWGDKRGAIPEEFVQELASRILRGKNIEESARAIRFLPDGAASNIYPQLKQITEDKQLREQAYAAIIRLGDGNKHDAVIEYVKILDEFQKALNEKDHNLQTQKIREMGDAPIGAIIGLCRIGADALPAKDALLSLVNEDHPNWTVNELAVDTLIQMGLIQELKQRYETNENFWKQILRAASEKERDDKKGKEFCGKRIV